MCFLYDLIFFYVPYRFYFRAGQGNEILVFSKSVLLIFTNIVSLFLIYCIVMDVPFRFSDYPRGVIKFFGLLSLTPFVIFYLLNRAKYKRRFKEFERLRDDLRGKLDRASSIYIYGSIIFLIITALYPIIS
jgi:hypothetical protein